MRSRFRPSLPSPGQLFAAAIDRNSCYRGPAEPAPRSFDYPFDKPSGIATIMPQPRKTRLYTTNLDREKFGSNARALTHTVANHPVTQVLGSGSELNVNSLGDAWKTRRLRGCQLLGMQRPILPRDRTRMSAKCRCGPARAPCSPRQAPPRSARLFDRNGLCSWHDPLAR